MSRLSRHAAILCDTLRTSGVEMTVALDSLIVAVEAAIEAEAESANADLQELLNSRAGW
jgi:hypothetical protein